MYHLNLYSAFSEDKYEKPPLMKTDKLYFIKKYFQKPRIENREINETVDILNQRIKDVKNNFYWRI